VPLNLILSLGIAVWLSSCIGGKNLVRAVFFLPVVTPIVATALIGTLLYAPGNGVFDWFLGSVVHLPAPNWLG